MAKLIGKGFVNDNKGTVDEGGFWTVTVLMIETNYFDDGTTEEETIETKSISSDFDNAHETAMVSALTQLREEAYDKGFRSLIVARKAKNDNGADNTNTLTQ